MKRILTFLCVLMLLCGTTTAQAAESSARLTCGDLDENGIARLTLYLSGDISGDTMGLRFNYDASVLEVVKSECGWIAKGVLQDINTFRCQGVWAASEPQKLDGEVCVLAFRIKDRAKYTSSAVSCTVTVKNGAQQVGEFTAEAELRGDCTHTYGEWEKKGELGHTRACALCGQQQIQSHNWDEGTVAADPKNPLRNIRTKTCAVCGEIKETYEEAEPTQTEQTRPAEPADPEETTPVGVKPEETKPDRPDPTPVETQTPAPEATSPEQEQTKPTYPESQNPDPTAPGNNSESANPEQQKPETGNSGNTPDPTVPGKTPDPTVPGNNNPDPTAPGNDKPQAADPEKDKHESSDTSTQNPEDPDTPNTPQSGQIGPGSQPENKPGQNDQSGQQSQNPGQSGNQQENQPQKPVEPGNQQQGNQSQQNKPAGNTPQQGTIGPGISKPEPTEENAQGSGSGAPNFDSHDHEEEGYVHGDHVHLPNGETIPEVIPAPNAPDTTKPAAEGEQAEQAQPDNTGSGWLLAALMLVWAGIGGGIVIWQRRKKKK